MKFLQLVSVGLAALIGSTCAAPAPAPPAPVVTNTDLYNKFGGSGMTEGTTYKAEIKWPKPAAADPNPAIEAARKAVNAKHFAYAIVSIKKTVRKGTKTKPDQITMDVDGWMWDLQLGDAGAAVMPPVKAIQNSKSSILTADVTRGSPTRKTKAQIEAIGTYYSSSSN